jgi:hypothetical protein
VVVSVDVVVKVVVESVFVVVVVESVFVVVVVESVFVVVVVESVFVVVVIVVVAAVVLAVAVVIRLQKQWKSIDSKFRLFVYTKSRVVCFFSPHSTREYALLIASDQLNIP